MSLRVRFQESNDTPSALAIGSGLVSPVSGFRLLYRCERCDYASTNYAVCINNHVLCRKCVEETSSAGEFTIWCSLCNQVVPVGVINIGLNLLSQLRFHCECDAYSGTLAEIRGHRQYGACRIQQLFALSPSRPRGSFYSSRINWETSSRFDPILPGRATYYPGTASYRSALAEANLNTPLTTSFTFNIDELKGKLESGRKAATSEVEFQDINGIPICAFLQYRALSYYEDHLEIIVQRADDHVLSNLSSRPVCAIVIGLQAMDGHIHVIADGAEVCHTHIYVNQASSRDALVGIRKCLPMKYLQSQGYVSCGNLTVRVGLR